MKAITQLWNRFRSHSTLVVLAAFFTLLTACNGGGNEAVAGEWYFAGGEAGTSKAAVYGTLKLGADGRYEDNHRISGILTFSKGTYAVSGNKITLTPDAGTGSPTTYEWFIGDHKDAEGKAFNGLLLTGTGLKFILTKEKR